MLDGVVVPQLSKFGYQAADHDFGNSVYDVNRLKLKDMLTLKG